MEYKDSQISEKAIVSDDYALASLLDDFHEGDRQAYNVLIKMLKRSEPKVEMAVRALFAKGDGLVEELVCQAYYPFVEALCKYKFKGKAPQEITDLTNSVLRELVRSSAKLSPKQSLKNLLYQRVCLRYSDYMNSDSVNSFGHQSAEKRGVVPNEALADVKKATARQEEASPAPEVRTSANKPESAVPQAQTSKQQGVLTPKQQGTQIAKQQGTLTAQQQGTQAAKQQGSLTSKQQGTQASLDGAGSLPQPRRQSASLQGSEVKSTPLPKVAQPGSAQIASDAQETVTAGVDQGKAAGSVKPILPPQDKGAKEVPKVKGFPSGSHEVRSSGPYSDKLIKALARLAERDYDTYQIIVKHYFNRYSYQHLCQSLGNRPIVAVGLSLYRGLVDLGRQVFDLK